MVSALILVESSLILVESDLITMESGLILVESGMITLTSDPSKMRCIPTEFTSKVPGIKYEFTQIWSDEI